MVKLVQNSFLGGMLDWEMTGRQDFEKYRKGATLLKNFCFLKRGAITRRPGTDFVADLTAAAGIRPGDAYRIIPFSYLRDNGWALVLHAGGGLCVNRSGAVLAVEGGLPYSADALADLTYTQCGDVLFLAHWDYPPGKVTHTRRGGAHSFAFSLCAFNDYTKNVPTISALTGTRSVIKPHGESGSNRVVSVPNGDNEDYAAPLYEEKYVATSVVDGVETVPSAPKTIEYKVPWTESQVHKLTISAPADADEVRIYRMAGGVYGLIGQIPTDSPPAAVGDATGLSSLYGAGASNMTPVSPGAGFGTIIADFPKWGAGYGAWFVNGPEEAASASIWGSSASARTFTVSLGGQSVSSVTLGVGHAMIQKAEGQDLYGGVWSAPFGGAGKWSVRCQYQESAGGAWKNFGGNSGVYSPAVSQWWALLSNKNVVDSAWNRWVGEGARDGAVAYTDIWGWRFGDPSGGDRVKSTGLTLRDKSGISAWSNSLPGVSDCVWSVAEPVTVHALKFSAVAYCLAPHLYTSGVNSGKLKLVWSAAGNGWRFASTPDEVAVTPAASSFGAMFMADGYAYGLRPLPPLPYQGATVDAIAGRVFPFIVNHLTVKTRAETAGGIEFKDNFITPDTSVTPPKKKIVFAGANDYPSCVSVYQQRLVYASTRKDPARVWMSKIGDFYTFAPHDVPVASDPLDFILPITRFARVNHIVEMRRLLAFSDACEWVIGSNSSSSGLTFETVQATPQSFLGSDRRLPPLICNNALVFSERTGQTVRRYGYQLQDDGYGGTDVSVLSSGIFDERRIVDWAYRQHPDGTVWCVFSDGKMAALTLMEEQDLIAWGVHELGGPGARVTGAANTYALIGAAGAKTTDELFLTVERGSGEAGRVTVEAMRPAPMEDGAVADAVCLDGARVLGSAADAREGAVWIDPGTGASLQAPADGCLEGFPFRSQFTSVYPVLGDGVGNGQFDRKVAQYARLRLMHDCGGRVKAHGAPESAATRLRGAPVFTGGGMVRLPRMDETLPLAGVNDGDGRVDVWSDGPWPLTILMLETDFETEEGRE